jgi:2-oxoglutarate dehydrogenase E2 component (dihydrolipoamide succinyltransferase)
MSTESTVLIKLTAATVIDGALVRAGTKLEMTDDEAKSLLRLGKAELLTQPAAPVVANNAAAAQAAAAQAAAEAAKPAPAAPAPAPAAPEAEAAKPA